MSWQPPPQPNPFANSNFAAAPQPMQSGPTRRSNAGAGSNAGSNYNSHGNATNYNNNNNNNYAVQPPHLGAGGPQQRRSNTQNANPPQLRASPSANNNAYNYNSNNNYSPSPSNYPANNSNYANSNLNSNAAFSQSFASPPAQPSAFNNPYAQQPQQPAFSPTQQSFQMHQQPLPQQQQQFNNAFGQPQQPSQAQYGNYRPQPQQSQFGGPPNANLFGIDKIQEFQQSAAGQLGMQLGQEALKQGQAVVNQNINRFVNIPKLKYYFNVSNSYVLNKLRLLVFSFRQKSWTRLVVRSDISGPAGGMIEGFKPPREDLNAPDLYIPIMAFVTYVLLVGITLNTRKKFEPEVLGMTSSTALLIIAFEVLAFKLCCYLLNVTTEVPFFDLIAYCGYKFVPVLICLILNLVFPIPVVVYAILAYLIISYGFFTLRSVKYLVLPESSSTTTLVASQRQQRIYLLFLFVGIQALTSFFLFYF
ncbi:UNVERIFIED_CONTAM: hypothetical protein HDU68_006098 [Siphonaria sp. JEL0065]|nr:hypothetical protein HDU68_006098 [Siphonaria sp. JEL0065]